MNNVAKIRQLTEFFHTELVKNNNTSVISSDDIKIRCIFLKYPRMVFVNEVLAYVDYNADIITYLNNQGTGTTFDHDISEEELFQQSLLDDTLSIFEVQKIKEIYTYIMENNLW